MFNWLNITSNLKVLITILTVLLPFLGYSQVYESSKSDVSFFSEAPLQDIEASNHQAVSYFDLSTRYVVFDVLIEGFQFEQGLMEQHFNDRYLESREFPKAEFFGKVIGFDPGRNGPQDVTAMGELTVHGVTNVVKSTGRMTVMPDGELHLISKFSINIEDFSIDTPRLLLYPVAQIVEIKVEARYHLTGS